MRGLENAGVSSEFRSEIGDPGQVSEGVKLVIRVIGISGSERRDERKNTGL